ncbi:unnamed protein product [Closterium sp. NIES-64]|nr:unnamed protein product [Closterium sp. NIES-64]
MFVNLRSSVCSSRPPPVAFTPSSGRLHFPLPSPSHPPPVAFTSLSRRLHSLLPSPSHPSRVAFTPSSRRLHSLLPSPSLPPPVAFTSPSRRLHIPLPSPSLPPPVAFTSLSRRLHSLLPSPSLPPPVAFTSPSRRLHFPLPSPSLPPPISLLILPSPSLPRLTLFPLLLRYPPALSVCLPCSFSSQSPPLFHKLEDSLALTLPAPTLPLPAPDANPPFPHANPPFPSLPPAQSPTPPRTFPHSHPSIPPLARPPLTCLFHPLTHLVLSHSRGATLPPPPHLTTLHRTPLLQDLTPRPAASSGYKQQYPSHTSTSTLLLSLTPLCYTSPTPPPLPRVQSPTASFLSPTPPRPFLHSHPFIPPFLPVQYPTLPRPFPTQ